MVQCAALEAPHWMQTRRPSPSDPGLSCQIMAHNGPAAAAHL